MTIATRNNGSGSMHELIEARATASTVTDTRTAIVDECTELAELLDGLPSSAWDAPSLCAGWRTREVVAHLTMPARYSMSRFMFELLKARGNFNRMADLCARRDAMRPTTELAARLRDGKLHAWKPPGGGYDGALTHVVIHGLDFTVSLGITRRVPERRVRTVLEMVANPRSLRFFGVDLDGVELKANDTDWSFGSGSPVAGQAQDLALALCGRKLPIGRLHGEAAVRFTRDEPFPADSSHRGHRRSYDTTLKT